jgi:uncharacterized protein (DUF433 family)
MDRTEVSMATDVYRTPLLTARETARHLRMPESTLNVWLAKPSTSPLVHSVAPEKRGWPRVPFVGIIEAYVLRSLRELGASMDDVREAAAIVRAEFDDPYGLASQRIAIDGVAVFVRLADESVIHVRDRQSAFVEVLSDYLRFITWSEDGQARSLKLRHYPDEAEVVIDPRFGWGAPVLAKQKIPVDAVVSLWQTGESMDVVAEEFDLTRDLVENDCRAAVAV